MSSTLIILIIFSSFVFKVKNDLYLWPCFTMQRTSEENMIWSFQCLFWPFAQSDSRTKLTVYIYTYYIPIFTYIMACWCSGSFRRKITLSAIFSTLGLTARVMSLWLVLMPWVHFNKTHTIVQPRRVEGHISPWHTALCSHNSLISNCFTPDRWLHKFLHAANINTNNNNCCFKNEGLHENVSITWASRDGL